MGIILHVYSFTNMKTTNFTGLLMFSFLQQFIMEIFTLLTFKYLTLVPNFIG